MYECLYCAISLEYTLNKWLSLCDNSLTFALIFHTISTALFIIDTHRERVETKTASLLAVVHLGLQLACVTIDVAETGNKTSLTPNFRVDHGRFHRNSQECRDVEQLVGFRIANPDIRGDLGSTLCTST